MDKFQELSRLVAGKFEHVDGILLAHLEGTRRLLTKWGACVDLQDAGLCDAAYHTAGFEVSLVSAKQQNRISTNVGVATDQVVD